MIARPPISTLFPYPTLFRSTMLRDNLLGLIEPMQISAGVDPLALTIRKQGSDDRPSCLENPRPERAESSLTENVTSPFQAEPGQLLEAEFWAAIGFCCVL